MEQNKELSTVDQINTVINRELTKETAGALLATTFKGLDVTNMKKALMEGMLRGYTFQDFLKKRVYAVPFSDGYTLVTSIEDARVIGMESGIVGVDAPVYTETDGKIETCTVTVKRKVSEYIGSYTATVYFSEYYKPGKGRLNLWDTKPRTMIAKVAEMHALRKACPEKLAQQYIEDELQEPQQSRMKEVESIVKDNPLSMGNFIKNEEAQEVQGTDSPEN